MEFFRTLYFHLKKKRMRLFLIVLNVGVELCPVGQIFHEECVRLSLEMPLQFTVGFIANFTETAFLFLWALLFLLPLFFFAVQVQPLCEVFPFALFLLFAERRRARPTVQADLWPSLELRYGRPGVPERAG